AIGPRLAKIRNGRHHQTWVQGLEVRIAQSQGRQHPGREVLDHHVHLLDQFPYQFLSSWVFQVNGHTLLMRVQVQEQPTLLQVWRIARKWPCLPRWIARAWTLDLDDLSAIRSQELCAVRPSDVVGQIKNSDVC